MSAARVAKLEALLDRVRRRTAEPRASGVAVAAAAAHAPGAVLPFTAKPGTIPPPRKSEPEMHVVDDAELVEDVDVVMDAPAEEEMSVEVSTEEVDVDASADLASETHMRTTHGDTEPPSSGAAAVATDAHRTGPPAAEAEVEYPRHTPPPESGSVRAQPDRSGAEGQAGPEETHDPSGQWGQVQTGEETGVRSSSRLSSRPSAPASARQPSAAPPVSGRHPSMPAPAAGSIPPPPAMPQVATPAPAPVAASAAAHVDLVPVVTHVVLLGAPLAAVRGALPTYSPTSFGDLLDATLDLS